MNPIHSIASRSIRPLRYGLLILGWWGMGAVRASESLPVGAPTAVFEGRVIDAESGEPVGFTYLLIEPLHVWQAVRSDGTFRFEGLPPGTYLVRTYRLGYRQTQVPLTLCSGETTRLVLRLKAEPLMLQGAIVASRKAGEPSGVIPDVVVSGRRLRQNLGMTIAETLEPEAGVDQVSMGPAPARPVLRGMTGDRFLLLEDGMAPGDLSASSADHAVAIEPLVASRIAIIRGPEAFLFGSGPVGGVLQVIREAIPSRRPERYEGSFSFQGESMNRGGAGGGEWCMPIGPLVFRLDGGYRKAGDLETPLGRLANTHLATSTGSIGMSRVGPWGYLGFSIDRYDSRYGIPPDPKGGHPGGVDIDLDRIHMAGEGLVHVAWPGMRHFRIRIDQNRYHHMEIERNGEVGVEFGVLTQTAHAMLHLGGGPWLEEARIGITSTWSDFAAGGFSFLPHTEEKAFGFFAYDERTIGKWQWAGAVRYDRLRFIPAQRRWSPAVGLIRQRRFSGLSGGGAIRYQVAESWVVGLRVMRTLRPPRVEELFSEGPHLAVYAYEVGCADLGLEQGWGGELSAEGSWQRGMVRLAFYRHGFSDYLFPKNTGLRSARRADLDLYRYSAGAAEIEGLEASWEWSWCASLGLTGSVSGIRGFLKDGRQPLPQIPPLSGRIAIRSGLRGWGMELLFRWASRQDRLGPFETPTAGYGVWDFSFYGAFSRGPFYHTLTGILENLGNTVYRRHLNRLKAVMPEPGRSIRILYRVYISG